MRLARAWVATLGLGAVLGLLWWQYGRAAYLPTDVRWFVQFTHSLTEWRGELPPQAFTLLTAVGIWLRSVLDGRRLLMRDDIWHASATGFIAFAILLIAGRIDPAALPPQTDAWLVALITVSMSALAFSSLELARNLGDWKTPKQPQPSLNRDWLLSVVLVIAAVLAVGLALGALLSPATIAYAFGWLSVVFGWIAALLNYVLMAVAYVLFLFLTPLFEWLRARIGGDLLQEPLSMGDLQPTPEPFTGRPNLEIPPLAAETLRWLGMAGVLLVIVVLFALALRYFRRGRENEIDETRETILTRALLQEQLASLWQSWLHRLRRPLRATFSPYLALEGEQENRRAIRALYQALLALTKSLGCPRAPAQTPAEYRSLLTTTWPEARAAWQTLTEEYVAARYGLHAPTAQQVDAMRQAWTQAEAMLTAQASGPTVPAQTRMPDGDAVAPTPSSDRT